MRSEQRFGAPATADRPAGTRGLYRITQPNGEVAYVTRDEMKAMHRERTMRMARIERLEKVIGWTPTVIGAVLFVAFLRACVPWEDPYAERPIAPSRLDPIPAVGSDGVEAVRAEVSPFVGEGVAGAEASADAIPSGAGDVTVATQPPGEALLAERVSEASVAPEVVNSPPVGPDPALLEREITRLIERWRSAWATRNVAGYLDSYAPGYAPEG